MMSKTERDYNNLLKEFRKACKDEQGMKWWRGLAKDKSNYSKRCENTENQQDRLIPELQCVHSEKEKKAKKGKITALFQCIKQSNNDNNSRPKNSLNL